jgi:hypothetical protein
MKTIGKLSAVFAVCLMVMSMTVTGLVPVEAASQESGRKTITVRLSFSQPQTTVEIAELPRGRYDFMITLQDINEGGTPGLDTVRLVNMDRRLGENYKSWERPEENFTYRESINIARQSVKVGMEFETNPIGRWDGGSQLYIKALVEWGPAGRGLF